MNRKVLFVDDDSNLLASFRRQLHGRFEVVTAFSGEQGIERIITQGPFAVIVSDMRMPEMDGIQFLTRVMKSAPESVRIMLTGHAELETSIHAVNEGHIFRFLIKPCNSDVLSKCLEDSVRQYQLVMTEKELLKNTLAGSIKVLIDILGLLNPGAFSRAARIRQYVGTVARTMHLPNIWQFEVAAMLSQIGCVTLPESVVQKIYRNYNLEGEEVKMYHGHPSVAYGLLSKIPRLETIAQMIRQQQVDYGDWVGKMKTEEEQRIGMGAQMLKAAHDFDVQVHGGLLPEEAGRELKKKRDVYAPEILDILIDRCQHIEESRLRLLGVRDLSFGMIADEDIRAANGMLLVARGQEMTYPVLARLQNFARQVGVSEPFQVILPLGLQDQSQ